MIKVTFVCLGNICRSPMAEAVFKNLIRERGVEEHFFVTSCGTSDCEEDNPVYPPAMSVLASHGIKFYHRARQINMADVKNSDYILIMDGLNLRDITRFTGGHYSEKIFLLGHFLPEKIDIDDPWYTRDFDRAYREIEASCRALLDFLLKQHEGTVNYK